MVEGDPFAANEPEETVEDNKPFWVLVVVLLLSFAFYQWYFSVSQQVSRNIERLSHPHATVSGAAWEELQRLFYYEWDAFEEILNNLDNREPITFLIVLEEGKAEEEQAEAESEKSVFKAWSKPLFFKADTVYCKTVREALLAIVHNDEKAQIPYSGNWESWWRENRKYFR